MGGNKMDKRIINLLKQSKRLIEGYIIETKIYNGDIKEPKKHQWTEEGEAQYYVKQLKDLLELLEQ